MPDKIYCVYEWIRPDTGLCFYVGYGLFKRPYQTSARSREFKQILNELRTNKLRPIVVILVDFQSQTMAMKKERERIKYHRKNGIKLVNKTS